MNIIQRSYFIETMLNLLEQGFLDNAIAEVYGLKELKSEEKK